MGTQNPSPFDRFEEIEQRARLNRRARRRIAALLVLSLASCVITWVALR